MSYYKFSLLLVFITSFTFSQNSTKITVEIEKNKISNEYFFETTQSKLIKKESSNEFVFCDEDNDGYTNIDLNEIKNYILSEFSSQFGVSEGVYICTNNGKVLLATDLNSNPQINYECANTNGTSMLDIAINQNGECFVSTGNSIKKINLNNCNVITNYSTNYGNINALSFDLNQNLYLGGFDSKVYRADSNNLGQPSPWHNFNQGYAAGDFVIRGGKMYIAWSVNNECRLYEVTVNSFYDYVSHIDLGVIPSSTFGLASELGQLYGITPTELYKIDTSNMTFTSVLTNTGSNGYWWGASGKNEAVSFDVDVFETNNDAANGNNPLPNNWINTINGGQTVYVSIVNTLTGESTIVTVNLVVNTPPTYFNPVEIVHCDNSNNSNEFNLAELKTIINSDSNIQVDFFENGQDAVDEVNVLPDFYSISTSNKTVSVRVTNLVTSCYSIFSIKLKIEAVPKCNAKDVSFCFDGMLDLSKEIELSDFTNAVLSNQDSNLFSVSYFLSQSNAENNIDEVYNVFLDGNLSEIEIFVKVENNNSLCYSTCSFTISLDEFDFVENDFYQIKINEGTYNDNSIIVDLNNSSDYSFSLDGVNFQDLPYFSGLNPGEYSVHIKNNITCQYSIENLYILNYPNYFTPNGDGFNDFWKINFSFLEPNMKIYIYDRFGKLLKELSPNSEGWDGIYIGNPVPASDYWFKVIRENGKEINGHFSLKR